jgi:hypothetical protein
LPRFQIRFVPFVEAQGIAIFDGDDADQPIADDERDRRSFWRRRCPALTQVQK